MADGSGKGRRILALWLPRLATDARHRARPEPDGGPPLAPPLAGVREERGRRILAAVDRGAEAAGLRPGMTLADARALEPGLAVFDADPEADARLLARIAGWCTRFTPWTAPDGADGMALDVTGCAHLFGGERALIRLVTERLAAAGFESRAALADTPAAAWGLARFGPAARTRVPPGGQRAALDPLPVAALRLPPAVVDGLFAVGLRRIGDLHAVPRAGLTARYGAEVARRLDQALGRLDEPLSPLLPVPPHRSRIAFAEPIATPESIAAAARHLLDALCRGLEAAGEGLRRLELTAHRIDARFDAGGGDAPQTVAIGTSRPVREPKALMRLLAERLERLEPGPGFEAMDLAAPVVAPQGAVQAGFGRDGDDTALGELVDRLGNRLGERAVLRLVPRPGWLPERSVAAAGPLVPGSSRPLWPGDLWPDDRPRPVRLLPVPEPVEVMAPVPDDPPLMFHWRGALHRVRHADGPERIEMEWWRRTGEPRDYYRVEDQDGRRFWLFRQGLYRPDARTPWFLHGFFGLWAIIMYHRPIPTKNPQECAMIHRIRIENFYSIRAAQTLDLRVPGTAPDDPRFRPSWSKPDVRLPTVVALYGANASGKSTVLRAALSLVRFLVNSFDYPINGGIPEFEPFMSTATVTKPTRLSIEFDARWIGDQPTLHRYELHINNHGMDQPRTVAYEALHHAPKRHFVRIFERRDGVVTPGIPLSLKPDDPRLSVRPNASVIATLAKFNHDLATRIWHDLNAIPSNFISHWKRSIDQTALLQYYSQHPGKLDHLNGFLRRLDAGLETMNIQQGSAGLVALFQHRGLDGRIFFHEESQGTQRFVATFPWLSQGLEGGWPIFMDELDADLHTGLLVEIIGWFHNTRLGKEPATNPHGAQLFLTAHNPALLDELEKEEVFFTEKDATGATTIYGAKDIQGLRREPSLSRKYLGGALGAVPQIG